MFFHCRFCLQAYQTLWSIFQFCKLVVHPPFFVETHSFRYKFLFLLMCLRLLTKVQQMAHALGSLKFFLFYLSNRGTLKILVCSVEYFLRNELGGGMFWFWRDFCVFIFPCHFTVEIAIWKLMQWWLYFWLKMNIRNRSRQQWSNIWGISIFGEIAPCLGSKIKIRNLHKEKLFYIPRESNL